MSNVHRLEPMPEPAKQTWKLTASQKDEAARLYESGLSSQQIAPRFNVSARAMHDVLSRRVEMRPATKDRSVCVRGHLLEGENVRYHKGRRYCRLCVRLRGRQKTKKQNRPDAAIASALYRARNPVESRAHRLVNEAVRCGRIVKPIGCEDCGRVDVVLHGHHTDYEQPLDVAWLCPLCHKAAHRKMDGGLEEGDMSA